MESMTVMESTVSLEVVHAYVASYNAKSGRWRQWRGPHPAISAVSELIRQAEEAEEESVPLYPLMACFLKNKVSPGHASHDILLEIMRNHFWLSGKNVEESAAEIIILYDQGGFTEFMFESMVLASHVTSLIATTSKVVGKIMGSTEPSDLEAGLSGDQHQRALGYAETEPSGLEARLSGDQRQRALGYAETEPSDLEARLSGDQHQRALGYAETEPSHSEAGLSDDQKMCVVLSVVLCLSCAVVTLPISLLCCPLMCCVRRYCRSGSQNEECDSDSEERDSDSDPQP